MSALSSYNDFFAKHRQKSVYITIGNETFNANSLISQESMSLESSLCSDENLRIGACESSCFRIRIAPYDDNEAYKDKRMFVSLKVQGSAGHIVDDQGNELVDSYGNYIAYENGATTEFDLGIFNVHSDKPTKDRAYRDLVCYDDMYKILNADVATWYSGLTFPMSVKNFRNSFFSHLHIGQRNVTLINDNFMIQGGFVAEDELSGKTIIEAICELNGVFGHINTTGSFEYISLPGAETVVLDHYQNGTCRYEDYETQPFTGVTAYSEDGNVGDSVGTDVNPYLIQNNPLIWGAEGTQDLEDALTNLLTKIANISYTPFTVSTYGNPMLPLGTPITMTSQNGSITSVVISKYMTGIQMLKDELSALGDEYYPNDINSTTKQITRTKGKTHIVENEVDKLNSEIWTIDPVTGQTVSQIQQLSNNIVLKVDSNGNIAKVELSVDADQGQIPTLNLQANKVNITSDTIQFDNNGYSVKGDIYTTKITPDNNEIYCDYSEIIDKSKFPDVDFTKDTKAIEHKNTYVKYSDIAGTSEDNLEAFNLTISSSTSFSSQYANPGGGVEPYWYSNIYADVVVTGKHYVMLSDSWTQFKADGGYIDDDGYLVFAAGKTWGDYVSYGMGGLGIMYQSFLTRGTTAIENFIKVVAYLKPEDYRPVSSYNVSGTGIPIVLAPQRSIGDSGDFDFVNKWGSSGTNADYGLANVIGTMWNKMLNPRPLIKAGTLVKNVNAVANSVVFTNNDIRLLLELPQGTSISASNTTVYVMNGDHDAQSVDVDYTYKSSIYWYAHFNGTPSAGNYRFNYIIVYFGT